MISLHTHTSNIFSTEYLRYKTSRVLLGRRRGPDAVFDSLIRGLEELDIDFEVNPHSPQNIALVLSGTEALRDAIKHKRAGQIKTLIAGPNVVIHPHQSNHIICNDAVDIVLVPSEWAADFWRQSAPEIAHKIKVWAAGVSEAAPSTRQDAPIIYDKVGDSALLAEVVRQVETTTSMPKVFTYGHFNHKDFLQSLTKAPYMVYLSVSESQGLALHEAWAHDVPTIVNKSTHWKYKERSWDAPQINAPYLVPEVGLIFDLPEQISDLIRRVADLHPKTYCDQNLSDAVSARKLLELI